MSERAPDAILPLNDLPFEGTDEVVDELERGGKVATDEEGDNESGDLGDRRISVSYLDLPGGPESIFGVSNRWLNAASASTSDIREACGEDGSDSDVRSEKEGAETAEQERKTSSIRPRNWTRDGSRRMSIEFGPRIEPEDDESYRPGMTLSDSMSTAVVLKTSNSSVGGRSDGGHVKEIWLDVPRGDSPPRKTAQNSSPPGAPKLPVLPGQNDPPPTANGRSKKRTSLTETQSACSIDFGPYHPTAAAAARRSSVFKKSSAGDDSATSLKYDTYGSCLYSSEGGWKRALKCAIAVIVLMGSALAVVQIAMDHKAKVTHSAVGELGPDEVQLESHESEDQTVPPDPPEDLGDLCSEDSISAWWGRRRCRRLCAQGDCCFVKRPHALSCSDLDVCQIYQGVCPNLDEAMATSEKDGNGNGEISHSV